MRRITFAAATALSAVVGAALLTAGPATAKVDDNPTVCAAAKKTFDTSVTGVTSDLEQARTQQGQGNTAAADASVQAAGAKLVAMGTQFKQEATTASDTNLQNALNALDAAYTKAGQQMTSVAALQNFDQNQLVEPGHQFDLVCGFTASPSVPSASPTS